MVFAASFGQSLLEALKNLLIHLIKYTPEICFRQKSQTLCRYIFCNVHIHLCDKTIQQSYLLHLRNRMLVTDCIILCMPSVIRLPASFSLITPTLHRKGRKNILNHHPSFQRAVLEQMCICNHNSNQFSHTHKNAIQLKNVGSP